MILLGGSIQAKCRERLDRVIDGDTLVLWIGSKRERVRLIGIDTPEVRANKKAWRDARRSHQDISTILKMGRRASRFMKALMKRGICLKVEFDVEKRDRYHRLLAYLYLPNGKMLNETMLLAGYAALMTVPPNVRYQKRFLRAYRKARQEKRGLWKE